MALGQARLDVILERKIRKDVPLQLSSTCLKSFHQAFRKPYKKNQKLEDGSRDTPGESRLQDWVQLVVDLEPEQAQFPRLHHYFSPGKQQY